MRPELLNQLAGAYVIGTLRGRARLRFERLCQQSPAARMAVQTWEAELTRLAVSVPAREPSPQLWQRIARQLGHVDTTPARNWWNLFMPAASFAFGLLMAVGLMQLYPGLLPLKETAPPVAMSVSANTGLPASYVGLLLDAQGKPAVLASALRHGKTLSLKLLQAVQVPADKVAVVWAFSKDGRATRLGTIPKEGKLAFEMANTAEALLSATTRLGVSFEDGTALPNAPGELILSGHCVKLW
ncbi:MAG TPA: anti-sigma factor [Rhodocyclaceae bacterium]|nr:anti-sigma factor [Rhodocyclaceae bacterium]